MTNKNIIILTLLTSILIMCVGYATLATDLKINGITSIDGDWKIKITDIEATNICTNCDAGTPTHDDTTANFNAELKKPGDSITYKITIKNTGTIDAKLNDVNLNIEENDNDVIIYSTTDPDEYLKAGDSTTYNVTTTYDPNATEIPTTKTKNFTSTILYSQE